MSHSREVTCLLCQRCEETDVTGGLSTKDKVTAHQNCLLYSSGIWCKFSPQFDDLFGFTIDDVLTEVSRGNKLTCHKCKKRGATAGCEVKRCMKSYHYPCAVQDGAKFTEDSDGHYSLYCSKHSHLPQGAETNGSDNGINSDSAVAGTSRNVDRAGSSKKRLSFGDSHKILSKRPRITSDSSSCSDKDEPNADMKIFAPIESDCDESANSVPEQQFSRNDDASLAESTAGKQEEAEAEPFIHSDAESQSLLLQEATSCTTSPALPHQTVSSANLKKNGPHEAPPEASPSPVAPPSPGFSSRQSPVHGPAPSPDHLEQRGVAGSPPNTSAAVSPAPPEASPSPVAPPPVLRLKGSIDSSIFWKTCNAVGCTQVIFTDFIHMMNGISDRIQSDQATQQDYDVALSVMEVSGKLTEFVDKQQKELKQKQTELRKAEAAMETIVSVLRR